MMMSVLDPLGFPTALQLVPGQHADDGLYIPILEQTFRYLQRKGLLVVGDCKMSATAIRAYIQAAGDYYLTPLSQVLIITHKPKVPMVNNQKYYTN